MAATSTYMTFLMHKASSNFEKLLDIKSFPDLGGDPELLETTTLSDNMKTFINGIQNSEGMAFEANYEKATFTALKALEGKEEEYAVWFGGTEDEGGGVTPTGNEGKFTFKGQLSVHVTSGAVNAVRNISIMIAPTTPITFA